MSDQSKFRVWWSVLSPTRWRFIWQPANRRLEDKPLHPQITDARPPHLYLLALFSIAIALGGAGCSTPGPNHLYILSPDQPDSIRNHAATGIETSDVPSYLESEEVLLGLAYDSYTDHLFLRLAPGNDFRVVDRPDRSIKREFTAPDISTNGGGDLAIRSSDRHLFLSHPTQPGLIEITLYGKFIRTITLEQFTGAPTGVAYDQRRDLLYILRGGDLTSVVTYDLNGRRLKGTALDRDVLLTTLAYDSDAREFYAQLRESRDIGVFDSQGNLLRTIEIPNSEKPAHFDVGPRSFLRLF